MFSPASALTATPAFALHLSLTVALAVAAAFSPAVAASPPPPTPKKPVNDTYHGVVVTDDYRWLENGDDPAVKAWSEAQNAHARAILDRLPAAPALRERIGFLLAGGSVEYTGLSVAGGRVFAIKHEPAKQQPTLVVMPSPDQPSRESMIVDPNIIDPKGLTTIDWFVPAPDGKLVAVSLSEGGSESGDVHVYDLSGPLPKRTGDIIPRAHGGTAGGSLAWAADSKSFYYTRYPREGERPKDELDFFVQVFHHTLGQPTAQDRYEVGRDFPKIAEIVLETVKDGGYVLASVQKGDGGEFMHWLKVEGGPRPEWIQLSRWEDGIVQAVLGEDGFLYGVSRKAAPRGKVVRLSLKAVQQGVAWTDLIPQDPLTAIETDFFASKGVRFAGGKLYVLHQAGGPNELRVYETTGKELDRPKLPPICTVGGLVQFGADLLIEAETFLTPPAWYRLSGGELKRSALFTTSPADFSDCEVVREVARSKDGTSVPLSIIRKKGIMLDGSNPALVWGYGGYGVNITPTFSPRRRVFIEQGGVYAIANIRGGGEFGQEWHRQGNLTSKQNVFDDFYAAAQWMVDNKYTRPDRLAIMGGSNGGLLMGATLTQHPELCKCVVSNVGIYDMLRVELSANGAFNITEFGTVADPTQFRALYAYSPYHHVVDGTRYPAVLMTTGANDPRVDPMQSRKMIARLQAAQPAGTFLLRTSANAGHGIGSSLAQRIEESVDINAFIFDQLGVQYRPTMNDLNK